MMMDTDDGRSDDVLLSHDYMSTTRVLLLGHWHRELLHQEYI